MSSQATIEYIESLLEAAQTALKTFKQLQEMEVDVCDCPDCSAGGNCTDEESESDSSVPEASSSDEEDLHEEDEWEDIDLREGLTREWFEHVCKEVGDNLSKLSFNPDARGGADIVYIPLTRLLTQETTRGEMDNAIRQQLTAKKARSVHPKPPFHVYCNRFCFKYDGDAPKEGEICHACGDKVMYNLVSDDEGGV